MRNRARVCGRGNAEQDVGRDRRCAAGIGNAPKDEPAEHRVADPNEIADGCRRVRIVDALRGIGPITAGGRDESAKRCDDDRAAGKDGTLADHVSGRARKICRAEIVDADVQSVGIDPERRVIGETVIVAGGRHGIDLEEIECPDGPGGDRRCVARRHEDPVVRCRSIDDDDDPTLRQTIVLNSRIGCRRAVADRTEKGVDVRVEHAVGGSRRLRERTDPAVDGDHILRRADIAHCVRRERKGVKQGGPVERRTDRLRR